MSSANGRATRALICASLAYDNIMVFKDRFARHILPDKIHILNVSFQVEELRREFGGCAGNIAYNLNLLRPGAALPMATAGHDFSPYAAWLAQNDIDASAVRIIDDTYTAQAYITTDLDDNQITAFHAGAMNASHHNPASDVANVRIALVGPDGRQGMLDHARQLASAGVPFIFDPGQGTPLFDGAELRAFLELADWLAVNDYEWQLIEQRTGLTLRQAAERVRAVFVTRGAEGSVIQHGTHTLKVPALPGREIVDPTGCGDAYRAGLLHGLLGDMDLETCARYATLLGGIKVEHRGTQNHRPEAARIEALYREHFGTPPP